MSSTELWVQRHYEFNGIIDPTGLFLIQRNYWPNGIIDPTELLIQRNYWPNGIWNPTELKIERNYFPNPTGLPQRDFHNGTLEVLCHPSTRHGFVFKWGLTSVPSSTLPLGLLECSSCIILKFDFYHLSCRSWCVCVFKVLYHARARVRVFLGSVASSSLSQRLARVFVLQDFVLSFLRFTYKR